MEARAKLMAKAIKYGVLSFLALIVILSSFGTVGAGERGIKTRFSEVVGVVQPGLYFKLPIIEHVNKMDVRTRTVNYDKNGNEGDSIDSSQLNGASKDLQDVKIGVMVNYHINPEKVQVIFASYRSVDNYELNVIEPLIREVVKSTSAGYTAEELVTKRAEFSDKVNSTLAEQLMLKDSVLERFSVTNFEFSPSFTQAIEAKVTAVQNAEAQKNKLEQVKYEAQQQIETAKAEAESIRIKAQAVTQQGGADYVRLQAIAKWNGNVPTTMIPGASVPFIDLR